MRVRSDHCKQSPGQKWLHASLYEQQIPLILAGIDIVTALGMSILARAHTHTHTQTHTCTHTHARMQAVCDKLAHVTSLHWQQVLLALLTVLAVCLLVTVSLHANIQNDITGSTITHARVHLHWRYIFAVPKNALIPSSYDLLYSNLHTVLIQTCAVSPFLWPTLRGNTELQLSLVKVALEGFTQD